MNVDPKPKSKPKKNPKSSPKVQPKRSEPDPAAPATTDDDLAVRVVVTKRNGLGLAVLPPKTVTLIRSSTSGVFIGETDRDAEIIRILTSPIAGLRATAPDGATDLRSVVGRACDFGYAVLLRCDLPPIL